MKKLLISTVFACVSISAQAEVFHFSINALDNSTNIWGGPLVGASATDGALFLSLGQQFEVSTDADQRWHGSYDIGSVLSTNADGAVGSGWDLSAHGISAPVGALVGAINNDFRLFGAGQKTFNAWASGELKMYYWDGNSIDNSGSINSFVSSVPEPETYAMLGLGLLCLYGAAINRRKSDETLA